MDGLQITSLIWCAGSIGTPFLNPTGVYGLMNQPSYNGWKESASAYRIRHVKLYAFCAFWLIGTWWGMATIIEATLHGLDIYDSDWRQNTAGIAGGCAAIGIGLLTAKHCRSHYFSMTCIRCYAPIIEYSGKQGVWRNTVPIHEIEYEGKKVKAVHCPKCEHVNLLSPPFA